LKKKKKVLWEKFTHTGRRCLSIVARDYNTDIKNGFYLALIDGMNRGFSLSIAPQSAISSLLRLSLQFKASRVKGTFIALCATLPNSALEGSNLIDLGF